MAVLSITQTMNFFYMKGLDIVLKNYTNRKEFIFFKTVAGCDCLCVKEDFAEYEWYVSLVTTNLGLQKQRVSGDRFLFD